MTDAPKISLNQQLEAVQVACSRQAALANGTTLRALRPKNAEEYDLQRLQAVTRTLVWLRDNQEALAAFLGFSPEQRAAIIADAKARFGTKP